MGTVPHVEIGLLSSERSFELDYSTYRDFSGAYAMLSELHWPFDVLTEKDLSKQRLETLAVLVVPTDRPLECRSGFRGPRLTSRTVVV